MAAHNYEIFNYVNAPVFVLEVTPEGHVEYAAVNDQWVENACKDRRSVIGHTAERVFPDRSGKTAYEYHLEAAQTAKPKEYNTILTLGTQAHHVATTLRPIVDDAKQLICIIGTSMKTTENKKHEEALAIQLSTQRENEQGIALAAHDLRTPMRNIATLIEMIREDIIEDGGDRLSLLDTLEGVAKNAKNMISDILSMVQTDRELDAQETFPLREVGAEVMILLDPTNDHSLDAQAAHLFCERVALQIICRNLCDNAIKHCGKTQVELGLSVKEMSDGWLEFTITDNGNGFANPAIAFLDGGKLYADSGFGLLGVRRLVRTRGGEISARNCAEGGGAAIRFTFPGRLVAPQA